MTANNLQLLLTKYYTRKGGQVLFKNKYSLNKLSLEMWDEKNDKGIEPSTLSRVINGKRLFTYEQLKTFCKVLNIKGNARKDLIKALRADYLERSDLTLSDEEKSNALLNEAYQSRKTIKLGGLFILIGLYIALFFWWLFLFVYKIKETPLNDGYGTMYMLVPFFGGIIGLLKSNNFDSSQQELKLSIFIFSIGLLTWSGGNIIWGYYKFVLHIIVAYPSLADLSYIVSWPLWLGGLFFLAKSANKNIGIGGNAKKIAALVIFVTGLLLSYSLLILIARNGLWTTKGGIIKTILDFYYPVFDILIIITIILRRDFSFKKTFYLKKFPIILLLIGFTLNFIGDLSLNYTSTLDSYYQGGWIDFILTTAMFFLSLGLNTLDTNTV